MWEGGGATNGDGSSSGLEESIAFVAVSTKLVHSTSAIGRFGPPFVVALIGEVRVVFLLFTLLFEVDVSGLLEAVEILSRLFPSAWPLGEVRLELEMTVTGLAMWKAQ